jgi:hypothetical protein
LWPLLIKLVNILQGYMWFFLQTYKVITFDLFMFTNLPYPG